MGNNEVAQLLQTAIDAICEIDKECCTHRNGIEHGLCNVKLEFQERVFDEMGKRLTEEPLIALLLRKKLVASGRNVDWEVPYPGAATAKRCDLVIRVTESSRLWLEIKLAWKAWFNCVGPPNYSNRAYATYLDGRDRTHSLRHDFEKVRDANFPAGDYRAVCLIGFDCASTPMDRDVTAIAQEAQKRGRCEVAIERHWLDRRSSDFRINVWAWMLSAPSDGRRAGTEDMFLASGNPIERSAATQRGEELYDVERAIAFLQQLGPRLIRGSTATPGHQYYDQVRAIGPRLKKCTCGQQKLGWMYPEFISRAGTKVLTVGGDAKSNKISCGDKGYHSSRYSNDPACC